jgi:hypothetical protein
MKHLLTLLLLATFCAVTAQGQIIKSLGYNTTNGNVIYSGTNALTFTNALSFGTNAAVTRTNLSLGSTWLTNTNVTNFRSAIGLGTTNEATFKRIQTVSSSFISDSNVVEISVPLWFGDRNGTNNIFEFEANDQGIARSNLSLGLPALTNTSNLTMMRELAGSTNTNEPYSGVFRFTDPETEFTYIATVSNGIILRIEEF